MSARKLAKLARNRNRGLRYPVCVLYSADVVQDSSIFFDFTSDRFPSTMYGHYSSIYTKILLYIDKLMGSVAWAPLVVAWLPSPLRRPWADVNKMLKTSRSH